MISALRSAETAREATLATAALRKGKTTSRETTTTTTTEPARLAKDLGQDFGVQRYASTTSAKAATASKHVGHVNVIASIVASAFSGGHWSAAGSHMR